MNYFLTKMIGEKTRSLFEIACIFFINEKKATFVFVSE